MPTQIDPETGEVVEPGENKTTHDSDNLRELEEKCDSIKTSINKIVRGLPVYDESIREMRTCLKNLEIESTIDELSDELKKAMNTEFAAIKRQIENLNLQLKHPTTDVSKVAEGILSEIAKLKSYIDTMKSGIEAKISESLGEAAGNSTRFDADTVVKQLSYVVKKEVNGALGNVSVQVDTKNIDTKSHFLLFSVAYALIAVLAGIFAMKGYICVIENFHLLRAAIAFSILSALSLVVLNIIGSANDLYDETWFLVTFHVAQAALCAIALGLSCGVLAQPIMII